MAGASRITADYVRSRLDYDPATGGFTWRERVIRTYRDRGWNTKFAGKQAGTVSAKDGYLRIIIDCKGYLAHRLAWLHVHSEWPSALLDHSDGNPTNNAISNLRLATPAQNLSNRGQNSNNKSGFKGVCEDRVRGGWIASIGVRGKVKRIGRYATREEAAAAYAEAAARFHGEFARTK